MWKRSATVLALCLHASAAVAQDDPDALARRHFESGVAYLVESDYENALKAFQKAYELSKRPDLLLNIATVHERSSRLDLAVAALEEYLKVAPESEQTETVRLRLANLQKRLEEQRERDRAEAEAMRAKVAASASPSASGGDPGGGAPQHQPNRVPAFVAFGVAGASMVGAVVTGVMAKSEYDDAEGRCAPNCEQSAVDAGKNLALVSTVLTGVAIVGTGVGLVLWLGQDTPQTTAHRLQLTAGARPGGAEARAELRF
ncbi:MAG: hypothetical protein R3B13_36885 [Polyangiaceae bacterium]